MPEAIQLTALRRGTGTPNVHRCQAESLEAKIETIFEHMYKLHADVLHLAELSRNLGIGRDTTRKMINYSIEHTPVQGLSMGLLKKIWALVSEFI